MRSSTAFDNETITSCIVDQGKGWWWYSDSSDEFLFRVLLLYLFVEALFFLCHVVYIIPRANLVLPAQEYMDYGRERHKLLVRIINRIQKRALQKGKALSEEFSEYLQQWFHLPPQSTSDTFLPMETETKELLSWAFFGKQLSELEEGDWEMTELKKLFHIMKETYSIEFPSGRTIGVVPKLVSFENVRPIPRPLIIYLAVKAFQCLGGFILRMHGFQYYTTPTHGFGYWYNKIRPTTTGSSHSSPLLFFHGLAPAGSTVYIPLILYGLFGRGEYQNRPIFLFENKNISYGMSFSTVFDEVSAVQSVCEALELHNYNISDSTEKSPPPFHLTVCGHSFGSCVATWLLRSPKTRHMVKHIILLDPVSILLSEPDVMNNFLYKPKYDIIRKGNLLDLAIFFVARTEVFTEHYLRRHFSWYNSELWLEDITNNSSSVQLLVALSGKDEIVNANKILQEIETHIGTLTRKTQQNLRLIYWKESGHASCITNMSMWRDLRTMVELQEKEIVCSRRQKTKGASLQRRPLSEICQNGSEPPSQQGKPTF